MQSSRAWTRPAEDRSLRALNGELPAAIERRWLLERLSELIAKRGFASFVTAPILEPTAKFFPDPWMRDAASVRRLARRVLRYAGLPCRTVEVIAESEEGAPWRALHPADPIRFVEIEGDRSVFAANFEGSNDALGSMCHEVAHAYRAYHALAGGEASATFSPAEIEERLTHVTSVYLGFGVLTVNRTYVHGRSDPASARLRVAESFSPDVLSFLLGAQAVARRFGSRDRRHVAGMLRGDPEAVFQAAFESLDEDADGLASKLGVPSASKWPKPPNLTEFCADPFSLED